MKMILSNVRVYIGKNIPKSIHLLHVLSITNQFSIAYSANFSKNIHISPMLSKVFQVC